MRLSYCHPFYPGPREHLYESGYTLNRVLLTDAPILQTSALPAVRTQPFLIKNPTVSFETPSYARDRDSSVGIATRYGLDGPGIESRWAARFSAPVQTGPGAHPASCTKGTGSFPGVKPPGRGADHPPPSKRRGHERVRAIALLTLWAFVACYRENLYLYLYTFLCKITKRRSKMRHCSFVTYVLICSSVSSRCTREPLNGYWEIHLTSFRSFGFA